MALALIVAIKILASSSRQKSSASWSAFAAWKASEFLCRHFIVASAQLDSYFPVLNQPTLVFRDRDRGRPCHRTIDPSSYNHQSYQEGLDTLSAGDDQLGSSIYL